MREIIKTNDGYMVQLPNGDYLHDANGDNLFDTYEQAQALASNKNTTIVEETFGDMIESTSNWAKANKAFYEWEEAHYGDDSDLSDDDRMLWVEGYLQALRDAS